MKNFEEATLGAGCFWCIEAIFQELAGVVSVEAGYSNGHVKNPSYKEVCTGTTGHGEVARIVFDPAKISFAELLEVFWRTHDPTTLNQQGADKGTQYRSGIYYHDAAQKEIAEKLLWETEQSRLWDDPIVTEIAALNNYSKAEDYHQNYYSNNPDQGYCTFVIRPKLDKFRKEFGGRLKQ